MAGAFLGLRPRRSASGEGDPQLRITKTGDPFLRRLLVNGANYIMGPFGKDTDLRRWGLELAEAGWQERQEASQGDAVARKLAVLIAQAVGHRRSLRADWVSAATDGTGPSRSLTIRHRRPARGPGLLPPRPPPHTRAISRNSRSRPIHFEKIVHRRSKDLKPPRPGDCDRRYEPFELERSDDSAGSGRTPTCTGPLFGGPSSSANGSRAVWCFEIHGRQAQRENR